VSIRIVNGLNLSHGYFPRPESMSELPREVLGKLSLKVSD